MVAGANQMGAVSQSGLQIQHSQSAMPYVTVVENSTND